MFFVTLLPHVGLQVRILDNRDRILCIINIFLSNTRAYLQTSSATDNRYREKYRQLEVHKRT